MPKPRQRGTGGQTGASSRADCWLSRGSPCSGGEHEVVALPLPPAGVSVPLEADVAALKPVLEEDIRQLRVLRIEVDLLWTHVRQLAERADEPIVAGASAAATSTAATAAAATHGLHCKENCNGLADERSSMQSLIREEVYRVLLQEDDDFHDKLKTRHADLQQHLHETEQWVKGQKIEHLSATDGTRKLLPAMNVGNSRFGADHIPLEGDLDFGEPVGKTLNSQDWLTLHASVKTEVQECRAELVRLCRRIGCWSETTTTWARTLPEDNLA